MCTICASFIPKGPDCAFANAPDGETMVATQAATAGLPTLSAGAVADYLTVGFWDGFIGSSGPFSFDLSAGRQISVDVTALHADGMSMARDALDAWTNVTGIGFVESGPGAQITFSDTQPGGFGGPTLIRGADIETATVNVSRDIVEEHGVGVGTISFFFYLHEIGHALGLGHPAQYNASADFARDASFANDSWQMSVMSYFGQSTNPHIEASYAVPITPMMADIVAIHRLYGTGGGVQGGDTLYGGTNTGGGVNFFSTTDDPMSMTIVDTGGRDTIDLRGDASGVRLDMRPGAYSDVMGLTGNLAIAEGTVVEAAVLGAGDDDVSGNGAANEVRAGGGDDVIRGFGGNDTLEGGAGNDLLIGGDGTDTVRVEGALDRYEVMIRDGAVTVTDRTGNQGSDTLQGIETVQFGSGSPLAPGGALDLSILTGVTSLSAAQLTTFVEMYVAYFDRAPDAGGLFYWGTRLAEGMTMGEIAASFFVQTESRALFPNAEDSAALVDAAYANLLERAPDAGGRAYWIEQLENGAVSRGEFMLAIINGAKANPDSAEDVRTVSYKGDIGLYYSAVQGLTDVEAAREVMDAYSRDNPAGGRNAARDLIDDFAADAGFTMSLAGIVDDPFAIA